MYCMYNVLWHVFFMVKPKEHFHIVDNKVFVICNNSSSPFPSSFPSFSSPYSSSPLSFIISSSSFFICLSSSSPPPSSSSSSSPPPSSSWCIFYHVWSWVKSAYVHGPLIAACGYILFIYYLASSNWSLEKEQEQKRPLKKRWMTKEKKR